jgi:TPR repeat protein
VRGRFAKPKELITSRHRISKLPEIIMDRLMDDDELLDSEQDPDGLYRAQAILSTDFQQARATLEEFADRGSVMAMIYLGFGYSQRGPEGREDAKKWYRMAYERGSSTGLFSLATIVYGEGDVDEAEKLWTDGASKNDGPSMFCLAIIYRDNPSAVSTYSQVRDLLERAHALEHLRATSCLSKMLMTGKFGLMNIPRGVLLFVELFASSIKVAYQTPTSRRLW